MPEIRPPPVESLWLLFDIDPGPLEFSEVAPNEEVAETYLFDLLLSYDFLWLFCDIASSDMEIFTKNNIIFSIIYLFI